MESQHNVETEIGRSYSQVSSIDILLLKNIRRRFVKYHGHVKQTDFGMTSGGDSWPEFEGALAEIDGMFEAIEDQFKEIESFVGNMNPESLLSNEAFIAKTKGL